MHTRRRVDAALSAVRWGVLLLTAVWIEAAVHPLLPGCCRAEGLAFVLRSIIAHHNYSFSGGGTQAASTLASASPHLAGQTRPFHVCPQMKSVSLQCVSPSQQQDSLVFLAKFWSQAASLHLLMKMFISKIKQLRLDMFFSLVTLPNDLLMIVTSHEFCSVSFYQRILII